MTKAIQISGASLDLCESLDLEPQQLIDLFFADLTGVTIGTAIPDRLAQRAIVAVWFQRAGVRLNKSIRSRLAEVIDPNRVQL